MNWMMSGRGFSLALVATATIGLAGCSKSETAPEATTESPAVANIDYSHGGWWCVEHGVPEEEGALCDKTLVAKFKEAGDWCEEHGRPESQCFICSPKRAEKFIAQYEAKTGHKPPKPE